MNMKNMNATKQCIKVSELRKIGYSDLEEWIGDEDNLYVGRRGRIFIHNDGNKRIFHYRDSKWCNPFSLKKHSLEESLEKYIAHLHRSGLSKEMDELK